MALSENTRETFNAVAEVLMWCFIFSMATLLFSFVMMVFLGDLVYGIHVSLFSLTQDEIQVALYTVLAIYKIGAFSLFLFPWIGIKLMLRKDQAK
jgi:hypothetical protein